MALPMPNPVSPKKLALKSIPHLDEIILDDCLRLLRELPKDAFAARLRGEAALADYFDGGQIRPAKRRTKKSNGATKTLPLFKSVGG